MSYFKHINRHINPGVIYFVRRLINNAIAYWSHIKKFFIHIYIFGLIKDVFLAVVSCPPRHRCRKSLASNISHRRAKVWNLKGLLLFSHLCLSDIFRKLIKLNKNNKFFTIMRRQIIATFLLNISWFWWIKDLFTIVYCSFIIIN